MTLAREIAVCGLLGVAVALVLIGALGFLLVSGPCERLHFVAPAAMIAPALVTAAVALDGGDAQAILKSAFVAIILAVQSGVISHATARALYLRPRRTGGEGQEEAPS